MPDKLPLVLINYRQVELAWILRHQDNDKAYECIVKGFSLHEIMSYNDILTLLVDVANRYL